MKEGDFTMLMNNKIKASEVQLTGLNGEDLGIIRTADALALAKKHKVDLVCTSIMSNPPPCKLVRAGSVKEEKQQERRGTRPAKVKEIRLSPNIEDHDYETKKQQIERILKAGDSVLLTVQIRGKEGVKAKELVDSLLKDVQEFGTKKTGIQLSGKAASVQVDAI
jgi:translation initiation factor IF-3